MLFRPRYVYKYRALNSDTDLDRCKDVIFNKRLFMPKTDKLNDPMESGSAYISLAVTGTSIYQRRRVPSPSVEEELKQFHILSLTEKYDSPQMWANYAGNYSGVCFAFSTHGTFKCVEPVIYTDKQFVVYEHEMENQEIEPYLHDSLLFKKKDWSNEYEWRIIKKSEDCFEDCYLNFTEDDLVGVIIGSKLKTNNDKMEHFIETCRRMKIPVWRVCPTYSSIFITPLGFMPELYGTTIEEQIENAYQVSKDRPPFI